MQSTDKKAIKIAGAGISGITAAIILAKAGKNVELYEQAECTGKRFRGDFQAIENCTEKDDSLDFLEKIGIEINFNYKIFDKATFWGPQGIVLDLKSSRPPFYLIKRGSETGSLDWAFQQQLNKYPNIKVYYNHPIKNFQNIDIIATGPVVNDENIDGFAAGYIFETDLSDRVVMIFDDSLAKNGYSYLIAFNHCGVIVTCISNDLENLLKYLEVTLRECQTRLKFSMNNIKKFIGTGNFFLQKKSKGLYIGEAGGFQDYLWGFGMRFAFKTAYLAAKSILENSDYYDSVNKSIKPLMKNSVSNRFLFALMGNQFYKLLLKRFQNSDLVSVLNKHYNPSFFKKIIYPIAALCYWKHIKDPRKQILDF